MAWLAAGLFLLGFFYLTAVPGSLLHHLRGRGASPFGEPVLARASIGDLLGRLAGPASYTGGLPHPITLQPDFPEESPAPAPPRLAGPPADRSVSGPAENPAGEGRPAREESRAEGDRPSPSGTTAREQPPPAGHTLDEGPGAGAARPVPPATGEASRVTGPVVRVMTFNIRHALGLDGQVSLERVARVLEGVDIAFLSEVDRFWLRSGLRDQPAVLQELTGMPYAFYAPALNLPGPSRQYGNLLLSRFPILDAQAVPLPRPQGAEARVMIEARLDVHGEEWFVAGVHLGLDREERRLQVEAIQARAAAAGPHRVLLGDFNATLEAPELSSLVEGEGPVWIDGLAGAPPTYPAWGPTARIDHLLLSPSLASRRQGSGVDSSDASDHLPAWVELQVSDRSKARPRRPIGLRP